MPVSPPTVEMSQKRYGTVSGWVYDPPEVEALDQWLTKVSQEKPLKVFTAVAADLANELLPAPT